MQHLWGAMMFYSYEITGLDDLYKTLDYFDKNTVLCVSSPSVSLLEFETWDDLERLHCSDEEIQLLRRWMNFLRAEGYDFDNKDGRFGETALLDLAGAFGRTSLAIVDLLLEFGANVHETNICGQNAIQVAMKSNVYEAEIPQRMREKLSLLIKGGADIHHCDNNGDTPSVYARTVRGCWDSWCEALERNGMDIEGVVRIENNTWLLDESSEWEAQTEASEEEEVSEEEEASEEEVTQEKVTREKTVPEKVFQKSPLFSRPAHRGQSQTFALHAKSRRSSV